MPCQIVYVRDYGSQFKMKSEMRVIMYEEFKKYDIRIPWPIRTVYQGDEKREAKKLQNMKAKRKQVVWMNLELVIWLVAEGD